MISPDLQCQWSNQRFKAHFYRSSYQSRPTEPMIGLFLQSWWLVQICRASDWSISLEPVIGPFLEGQRSDQFYTTNDWSISLGPVIGLFLKGQRSVHFYRASNGSIPISLGTDRFSSLDINCDTLTFTRITTHLLWHKSLHTYLDINHHTLSLTWITTHLPWHNLLHTYIDIHHKKELVKVYQQWWDIMWPLF